MVLCRDVVYQHLNQLSMRRTIKVQRTKEIVIGIDGGGTHTRVMVVDLAGNVLSYIENGASSIHKDLQAREMCSRLLKKLYAKREEA